MTLHSPRDVTRSATPANGTDAPAIPAGDIADRRAFVRDWIASRDKRVALLLGGLALAPLMLAAGTAQAQIPGDTLVRADSIQGVQSVALNPDGSASITLANGQVIQVAAAQVTVLADGTIAITVAAAETVSAAIATAGLGGAGAGVAAIGGAVGLAGALGAAGGGGGEPDVTVALSTGRSTLNAQELADGGSFVGRTDPGTLVQITVGEVVLTGTADEDGNYDIPFGPGQLTPPDGPLEVAVEVFELDEDDQPGDEPLFTTEITITVDTAPPEIEITGTRSGAVVTDLSTDNVINLAESTQPLTVFGTTDAEDGQTVTVTLTNPTAFSATATGTVSGGEWSVTFTAAQLEGLPDNATLTLAANVTDAALNPADEATFEITTDLTAPVVEIDPVTGNNILTLANQGNPVTVTGSTDAEPGTQIVLTFNGVSLDPPATVATGGGSGGLPNSWTAIIPGDLTGDLVDGEGVEELFPLTAQATDAAGNPSEVVTVNLETNFTLPSIAINPIAAGDGIPDSVNQSEGTEALVITGTTGNVQDDAEVTVQILQGEDVVATGTGQVSGGAWTVTFTGPEDGPIADLLDDGQTYTVTADVDGVVDGDTIAAEQATRNFSTDFTPPTVTITTPVAVDNIINKDEFSDGFDVIGTTDPSEAGRDVIVFADGTQVGSAPVQDGGGWTVPVSLKDLDLTGGETVDFTARVTDTAGNTGTSAPAPVTVDFSEPVITINDPAGTAPETALNATDAASLTITGTSDVQPLTVEVRAVDGSAVFAASSVAFDGDNWTATFDPPNPLAHDTLYIVEASGETTSGNPGSATSEQFLTDFVPPVVAITRITDDFLADVINSDDVATGFTVSGTSDEVGAFVSITLTNVTGGPFTSAEPVDDDGNWTVSIPGGLSLADGTEPEFVASISDPAGNTGTATQTATVDFTVPEITITGIGDDAFINITERDDDGITVSGTATGADGQTVTVTLTDDEDNEITATGTVSGETWFANVDAGSGTNGLGNLVQGPVSVTASVQNTIGNTGTADPFFATADFTAPIVTFDPRPFGDVLNAEEAADPDGQTISGTATGADGQDIEIRLFSGGVPQALLIVPTHPDTGAWEATFFPDVLQELPQGALAINAVAVDAAGNERNVTVISSVDTIAPEVSITSVQSGGEDVGAFINIDERDAGITVTGTTDDPADVTVTIASGSFTAEVTVSPDGLGNWTAVFGGAPDPFDLEDLPEGPLTITATSTDAAGNTGNSDAVELTADFTAPTITINPIGDDEGVIDLDEVGETFTISGTTSAPTTQTVTVTFRDVTYEDIAVVADPEGGDNLWSVDIPASQLIGLAPGDASPLVEASVASPAGNTGEADATFVTYQAAWTYLTETGRSGNEIRMAYFIEQDYEPLPEFFFVNVRLEIETSGTEYTGESPELGLPAVQYLDNPRGPVATDSTSLAEVPTDSPTFLAVWLAAIDGDGNFLVDGEGNIRFPAITTKNPPLIQFSLVESGPEEVNIMLSRENAAPVDEEDIPDNVTPGASTFGGQHWTAIGTNGDDTIVAADVDSLIRGRGGDDTIDVSGIGVNTIIFEADPTANGVDAITGFDVGVPRADRIGFADLTPDSLRGAGTDFESLEAPQALGVNTGFVVLTGALGDLDDALTAAAGGFGAADGDVFYLLATDSEDTVLAQVVISGGDATATVMATFEGLGDLSGVNDDTILGFSSV